MAEEFPNDETSIKMTSSAVAAPDEETAFSTPLSSPAAAAAPNPTPDETDTAASVMTRQSVEPPEIISHTARDLQRRRAARMRGLNGAQGGLGDNNDPPEQNLSAHFARDLARQQRNASGRARATVMATSIHNINKNSRGHVYFDGEESCASRSVGEQRMRGNRRRMEPVDDERRNSALEVHLAKNSAETHHDGLHNSDGNADESINDSERPAFDPPLDRGELQPHDVPSTAPRWNYSQPRDMRNHKRPTPSDKDKDSDLETLGGYTNHSARVKFADDMFRNWKNINNDIQSRRTGGRSNGPLQDAGSVVPPWRDRRVSSNSSVVSEQSKTSIYSQGTATGYSASLNQKGDKQKHRYAYLKKNAAILVVVAVVMMVSTMMIYGGGSSNGGGIDAQRGLVGGNHDMREPARGIMDNAHPVFKPQSSDGGIMGGGGMMGNGATPMQLHVNVDAGGGTIQQEGQVDWSKVPPHLRGYYAKMLGDAGAQQESPPDQAANQNQPSGVGNEKQPEAGFAVPVVDQSEFNKQQEELERSASPGGADEPKANEPNADELAKQQLEEVHKRQQAEAAEKRAAEEKLAAEQRARQQQEQQEQLQKPAEGDKGQQAGEAEAKHRAAVADEVREQEEKARGELQRMDKEAADAQQQQAEGGEAQQQKAMDLPSEADMDEAQRIAQEEEERRKKAEEGSLAKAATAEEDARVAREKEISQIKQQQEERQQQTQEEEKQAPNPNSDEGRRQRYKRRKEREAKEREKKSNEGSEGGEGQDKNAIDELQNELTELMTLLENKKQQ